MNHVPHDRFFPNAKWQCMSMSMAKKREWGCPLSVHVVPHSVLHIEAHGIAIGRRWEFAMQKGSTTTSFHQRQSTRDMTMPWLGKLSVASPHTFGAISPQRLSSAVFPDMHSQFSNRSFLPSTHYALTLSHPKFECMLFVCPWLCVCHEA